MKVYFTETITHELDINITDIDVISEEERLLLSRVYKTDSYKVTSRYYLKSLTDRISKRKNKRFYVLATITLSGSELPVGNSIHIPGPDGPSEWIVIKENKASGVTCFDPDEYTEDEVKLKSMLREWAENNGIKFGE